MVTTAPNPFIAKLSTDSAPTNSFASRTSEHAAGHQDEWRRIIDCKLIEWKRDPGQLDDEGVVPPNNETIQQAIQLAEALRDSGFPHPDSVVNDPNGGIVFERKLGDLTEVYHVWDDATVEYLQFEGARLLGLK